ncbi:PHO5 [Candida pseudojiufengensis]|uniref:PHO5 n=1 Tax=Candida pseudojiufengensis TaxID=497109 RepID=UPI002224DCA0|nr:PHO5 [Candida pseudojiufengensis]KAI5965768.1 PHO5 [Candida pseudojiufengensis]
MVSFPKVLNSNLLLVAQSIFQDLATPQQASNDQYSIINFLGGSGPYKQGSRYGISIDIPNGCSVEQVQMISRHGERFPSKGDGQFFDTIMESFKSYGQPFKGDLSFLNNYEYFVKDKDYYEKETSPTNSEGTYAGTSNALRHGTYFRQRYNDLYDNTTTFTVFTSNSGRCYQTANYFARGFLGDTYNEDDVEIVVIDEDKKMGGNSLTPRYACNALNNINNDHISNQFDKSYLQDILNRWLVDNPGLNLTTNQVSGLFLWIAFELNVRGSSPFSDLFTNEEYIKNGYRNDLVNYYSIGQGNNLSIVVGSPLVKASLRLLQESDQKIIPMFTHDTDMEFYFSSLGLINPEKDLPTDHVQFPNPYSAAELFPQGGRTYLEKLKCGSNQYIRFIMNDAVLPFPGCQNGIGFSCEFNQYIELINSRMKNVDYGKQCNVTGPADLTFFWDYKQQHYDAPLIDQ